MSTTRAARVVPADDPIVVVAYDPAWVGLFRELGSRLRRALRDVALRIDHIGSTSVVGLDAKPVIDVQVSVADFEPLDAFRIPLEELGFRWRADNDDLTKRYFREAPGARRTHIHVRRAGSWSEQFALLFRDYLRASPEATARYAAVKHELARRYRDDRQGYTDAKGPCIWSLMVEADAWAQRTGWRPGPPDA